MTLDNSNQLCKNGGIVNYPKLAKTIKILKAVQESASGNGRRGLDTPLFSCTAFFIFKELKWKSNLM